MKLPLADIVKTFYPTKICRFGNIKKRAKDIDLLIISDYFIGISIFKRRQLIKTISPKIDPVCFTNEEYKFFKKSKSSLYTEIKLNGCILYEL